ncbi:MAG: WD repeat-containing protein 26 [Marteilia pararefringens]
MYDLSAIGSFMLRFLPSMSNKALSLPTFGGDSQKLIASGDENSNNVLIWKITEQQPLCELVGHTQIVNQVHWNPKYPGLLASVSDDCSVRIWISESYHNRISCTKASSNTICSKF